MTKDELNKELETCEVTGHRVEILIDGKLRLGATVDYPVVDETGLMQCLSDILMDCALHRFGLTTIYLDL